MDLFIAGTKRTSNLIRNSIKINDELQEKPNRLTFKLGAGARPTEFEDVKVYEAFDIVAVDGTTITLEYDFFLNEAAGLFRLNDVLVIDIGEGTEVKKTITAIVADSTTDKIKMTVTPAGADGSAGNLAGIRLFEGNIVDVNDSNQKTLTNIIYDVIGLDYTRIFDKKLINDTYEDKTSRYIVNSMCNEFINKNQVIDDMDYANDAAIQAAWTETGDGDNPIIDDIVFQEGAASGDFDWTFAGGTATFTAAPASTDISGFTGAASGSPTKGIMGFWYECADFLKVTSFEIRIGSGAGAYVKWTITPTDNLANFEGLKFTDGTVVGAPDWTDVDYLAVVVTETADSSIGFDGFRVLEEEYFRHFPFVQTSTEFDNFRISRIKPTETMQRLANELDWYWYIDYDRQIHLFPETTNFSPFDLNETSNNFLNLRINDDTSRLINRQVVKGGDEVSTDVYPQVVEGDSVVKEWIMKNKFKNLEVFLDDNSVNNPAEVGTNTTNIKVTGHGLVTGDYIVNRTRANAVRLITKVDNDNYTVDTVAAQTDGDTISNFVAKVVGVEGLDAEAGNDYMSNFNEKSIRVIDGADPPDTGEFVLFRYNEVFPILVQRSENVSIANMENVLGYSDGIFDGQPVVDRTIKTRPEAISVAQAVLNKYANVVIGASFSTTVAGLQSGQLINIKDTASGTRNINQPFVIQKIITKQVEEGENIYTVTCSSLLYGVLEMLQQLFRQDRKLEVDEDAKINNIEDADETINITDSVASAVDDNLQAETVTIADGVASQVITPPFEWQPTGGNEFIWSLSSWA